MAREAAFKERTARRLRILKGRARRSLPGGTPTHRSVFFHMPKCGGTSLSEAMYATVPFNHRIGVLDAVATRRAAAMLHHDQDDTFLCHEDLENGQQVFDLREAMMLQHMAWDSWLIHGHVLWSEKAHRFFGERYKYVTLLRDPVARTISNFRMGQRSGLVQGDLDAYLDSDVVRRHARVYLRYLFGQNDIAEDQLTEATAIACQRLQDHFALVGFLDQFDAFAARYNQMFGVRLSMARLNAAPSKQPDYTPEQIARIQELCAPDLAIYVHAKSLSQAAKG